MTRAALKKALVVIVLSLVVITCTVACADLQDFIWAIFGIWIEEHADDVVKYRVAGSTGDQEVDAAINPKKALLDVVEANLLMEEAKDEPDDKLRLDKMEEAILLRPGDYTYRITAGTEHFKQGYTGTAQTHFDNALTAVGDYGPSHKKKFLDQGINELEGIKSTFAEKGFKDAEHCKAYFQQLTFFYGARHAEFGGSQSDWQQKERYLQDSQSCQ